MTYFCCRAWDGLSLLETPWPFEARRSSAKRHTAATERLGLSTFRHLRSNASLGSGATWPPLPASGNVRKPRVVLRLICTHLEPNVALTDLDGGGPMALAQHEQLSADQDLGAVTLNAPQHATRHLVQFYNSDLFLYETVLRFIGSGLANGDGVIVIATPTHLDSLHARLRRNSIDVVRALGTGQLTWLDAEETLAAIVVEGCVDPERFLETIGPIVARSRQACNGHVRAYGEMVDVLCQRGEHKTALQLEHHWNLLIAANSLTLLCGYGASSFSDAQHTQSFRQVCEAHTCVMPTESFAVLLTDETGPQDASLVEQSLHPPRVKERGAPYEASAQELDRRLVARKLAATIRQLQSAQKSLSSGLEEASELIQMLSGR
jgi:hypothetical protein